MDFYERLGIERFINAHDTYTVYGGSRMAPETLAAMAEAAAHFVDIEQMQRTLGRAIAQMTRNEAAYLTNGAAGGLTLATAVCMAKGSAYAFSRLPEALPGVPGEVVVLRGQRNAYDKAISTAGARMVEVGDADETLPFELEGAIGPATAAVFYFVNCKYAPASLPLEEVVAIAHAKGVPVVVDAAAQLPPAENLWKFTGLGADLVLFSGGKTLCGPQDSGLILGREALIEDCIRFGAPAHGVCRGSKTSREAMAGLYTALKLYLEKDPETEAQRLAAINQTLAAPLIGAGLSVETVPYGPVGQRYPRVFAQCAQPGQAEQIAAAMRQRHIYVGCEPADNRLYLSPLNLTEAEAAAVASALTEVLSGQAAL